MQNAPPNTIIVSTIKTKNNCGFERGSPNLSFFMTKNVDRIAIKDTYRRQGLGSMLYEKTIEIAEYLELDTCCEVNTLPRNDASLSFHERFGFREVGTKDYDDHSVVYLIKSN